MPQRNGSRKNSCCHSFIYSSGILSKGVSSATVRAASHQAAPSDMLRFSSNVEFPLTNLHEGTLSLKENAAELTVLARECLTLVTSMST